MLPISHRAVYCAGYGSFPPQDCIPDTVNGFKYVRDLYEKSNDTSGTRSSAPQSPLNAHAHIDKHRPPPTCQHMHLLIERGAAPDAQEGLHACRN